ncbi:MAG: glutaredoxin domain-containing protein [Pseudomonadota bacterium]
MSRWSAPRAVLLVPVLLLAACRQPAPDARASDAGETESLPEPFLFTDATPQLLLSVLDPMGRALNVEKPTEIPEALRARVMVVDLSRSPEKRQADRFVYFADLTSTDAQGRYTARPMSRFRGALQPRPAAGVEPVPAGAVVIYTTPWCGFCKRAKAYLKERGVAFVERDVEGSAAAARELETKLRATGSAGSGVPVIDIDGTLVMGFDRPRIDELLQGRGAAPSSQPAVVVPE